MFILKDGALSKKRSRDSSAASALLPNDNEHPAKRKRTGDQNTGHRPPGFWDNLSKVHLTKGALREFDRRKLSNPRQVARCSVHTVVPLTDQNPSHLKRFARHGGPDLTHIRGFIPHDQDGDMSQTSSGYKRSSAGDINSTRKSKSSYDSNFKQNMIESGIYPHNQESKAKNIGEIRGQLSTYRASLSPSRFDEKEFEKFTDLNERATGETRAMSDVFTIIEGQGRHKYHSDGPDHPFNNLEPLSEYLPRAKPDVYDGALPQHVDPRVRKDLGQYIVPCNDTSRPVAPNFFIEGKSARGRADVAKLQACHGGAVGSRAIHSLENYKNPYPRYDGKLNSYSSTYHPGTGTLKLYGHHMTAHPPSGGRHQYHMTQIKGYDMTSDRETFQKGATAFRNLRDLADSTRNSAIEAANRTARHAPDSSSGTATGSHSSPSYQHEGQSDTSADELASEVVTSKRSRHTPLASSRHDNSTPQRSANRP